MQPSEDLTRALSRAIVFAGETRVIDALLALARGSVRPSEELTIIGNTGMHTIPEGFIHGDRYAVSHGNLDLSSLDAIRQGYASVLRLLADKLRERTWKKIYLVPAGPTTLILQIKLLVYHITRLSTVDLYYSGGQYFELDLDYRDYLKAPGE
jgi:hypothetical protein